MQNVQDRDSMLIDAVKKLIEDEGMEGGKTVTAILKLAKEYAVAEKAELKFLNLCQASIENGTN